MRERERERERYYSSKLIYRVDVKAYTTNVCIWHENTKYILMFVGFQFNFSKYRILKIFHWVNF